MARRDYQEGSPAFEESVCEDWSENKDIVEVPLGARPLLYVWIVVLILATVSVGRIVFLNMNMGSVYIARAQANLEQVKMTPPLRGLITDRFGTVLADNRVVPYAFLNTGEFLKHEELQEPTLSALKLVLGIEPDEVWEWMRSIDADRLGERIPIQVEMNDRTLVVLKGLRLSTITVEDGVERVYKDGNVFSHVLGYVGFPNSENLRMNPKIDAGEMMGRGGVEYLYDELLRGEAGIIVLKRDARGNVLDTAETRLPSIGRTLRLTIDAELQSYFQNRLTQGLRSLGKKIGVGIAMNPNTGEVLALVQEPSYDNNILSGSGNNDKKKEILTSPLKPLFNRAISGFYSPASTVKPLVGIAALNEGVIDPKREIFSPGYLDIPNPFDPSKFTRYKDWRYQGYVNLASAIANSSDVYFYEVGGGAPGGSVGLGIKKLREWWQLFGFGEKTGIDLPGEAEGFLPSVEWKENRDKSPWLLGDTYNVSIGQGDLLVTPIQLITYLNAVATNGKLIRPVINADAPHSHIISDLTYLASEIKEVQKGMELAVTDPKATIYALHNLPFTVAAKTGSAQVHNNQKVNAFFVGYAPADNPQLIVLVLVEDAKEGSLNAIPIGGDVLKWYYENRMQGINNL
ncbi:MAG: penicillin-binding protein 2 [Patescibacteria group bacterium]|nr:penicillin-binding protein 2 [Patescibacteria group bacterium]